MSYVPPPDSNHDEASRITRSLKKSPSGKGFVHFASDGVYRSYSSGGEVVDYKQLSPTEIALIMASHKQILDPEAFEKLGMKMNGKDGRDVTDLKDLLHPGPHVRPLERSNKMTNNTRSTSPSQTT